MMRKNDSLVVLYKFLSLLLLTTTLTLLVACDGSSEPNIETTVVSTVPVKIANTVAAVTPESVTPAVVPTVPAKIIKAVATATPQSFTPTPVLPTVTSKANSKSYPTPTPTTKLLLSVQRQLEWPTDVGTSHFGALGNELDGFSGAWVRPLPGRFIWGLMEPSEGDYLWKASDNWVRKWQENRLGVLVMIWPFAQWDQNICHAEDPPVETPRVFPQYDSNLLLRMYPPCKPQSYSSWLSKVVERYDGDGFNDMPGLKYPIRHWEIGNEPDMQSPSHTLFQGNAEAYLNLLKLSYKTVKSADPNASVLIAAPSKWTPEVIEYWEPIFAGGSNFFDIGNMHSLQASNDFHASEYRRQLDASGSSSKPFWITEAGVFMGGKPLEQEELARITIPNYASAFAAGAQVVFRLSRGHNTGQVLETYLLAARTFGDFDVATSLTENVVRFDMPDGRLVFALWDNGTLPDEVTGKVKVITYKGEESSQDASVVISQVPILVVVEAGGGS
jgi:hypothetical protein